MVFTTTISNVTAYLLFLMKRKYNLKKVVLIFDDTSDRLYDRLCIFVEEKKPCGDHDES